MDENFMATARFALKMAVPVNLIFLLTFYGGFHCGLYLMAELVGFGVEEKDGGGFYGLWWNQYTVRFFLAHLELAGPQVVQAIRLLCAQGRRVFKVKLNGSHVYFVSYSSRVLRSNSFWDGL